MKNQKIGFLFDLDGVIIDSEDEYTHIWAQINREYPTGIENFEKVIKGCTLSKILEENYADFETRQAVAARLHELEDKMDYKFLPFAKEFLEELKRRDLPSVLVTSSDTKKMAHLWEILPEVKNYFNYIITGDMVSTSKPSPEGYLKAADKIQVNSRNCVVFEDSLQGVMAGKNADSFVVGVAGTLPAQSLAPYSHIIINNFQEINLDDLILNLKER